MLAQTYMDRLVISTNLKFNNFTHFNGLNWPLQSMEQSHRPSASELGFTAGAQARQVPAVILLLLRTCASHQTDTSGIVDQSYNANCPAILVQKGEIQALDIIIFDGMGE